MNLLLEKGGKSLLLFISSTYDVSSDARVARSYIGKNQINYFFDKLQCNLELVTLNGNQAIFLAILQKHFIPVNLVNKINVLSMAIRVRSFQTGI